MISYLILPPRRLRLSSNCRAAAAASASAASLCYNNYGTCMIQNIMATKLQHTSAIPKDFTFEFLKGITNDFSEEYIVGRGGYGVVYKV